MSGNKEAPRILLCGDVNGHLHALYKRVLAVNKSNGPFDALLCVGQFFPRTPDGIEEMKTYFTLAKPIPLPTYFIGDYGEGAASLLAPAKAKAAETGIPMDGVRICDNLLWLKGSGILNLKGLRVAYLSGKHSAELYQNAKAAAAAGAHHEDDVDTLRAFADDPSITDLFLSYPLLLLLRIGEFVPEGIDRMTTGSTISAELAKELKPRYHFAGSEGVFYAREPYLNTGVTHTTRFIGLAAVGNDKKQKFLHALSPTPASAMLSSELAVRPPNTTISPYRMGTHKSSNNTTPSHPGLKRDLVHSSSITTTESPANEGQYWRYDVNQGKRQRSDDGGNRVCFEFVKQGSCSRGETCKFKHDLGNGTPIPKGACFDFISKGRCERGADCRYRHSLEEDKNVGEGGDALPAEACWFCLSSPSIDTHLVVSVGDHCYCAIAKGPLVDSHILILPIEHHPSTISLPADAESELQRYKDALQKCFKTQGKATVFFERYLQLRAGTHAHLQAVPVPLQKASSVRSAFMSAAKEVGFEFDIICPSDTDPQARQALKEVVGGGANFFFVELPEGTILAHRLAPGEKLPMQFGREVMASLLGTPERGDWKACKLDIEEETSMADRFKEQFQSFDLMQSLV
ncbi:unnamed protein product [Sphagnum troendelagicum]|uniref:C3H1-type domain-containing protein n=1 Tax=Sphagnum troendelagicum TaxID=128251 RepID=A0ABP0UZN5_9BRYO